MDKKVKRLIVVNTIIQDTRVGTSQNNQCFIFSELIIADKVGPTSHPKVPQVPAKLSGICQIRPRKESLEILCLGTVHLIFTGLGGGTGDFDAKNLEKPAKPIFLCISGKNKTKKIFRKKFTRGGHLFLAALKIKISGPPSHK